jgi:hypothetical protein
METQTSALLFTRDAGGRTFGHNALQAEYFDIAKRRIERGVPMTI